MNGSGVGEAFIRAKLWRTKATIETSSYFSLTRMLGKTIFLTGCRDRNRGARGRALVTERPRWQADKECTATL